MSREHPTPPAVVPRVRWEYRQLVGPAPDSPSRRAAVAAAGAAGWELVAVVPVERTETAETLADDAAGVAQETTEDLPHRTLLYVFKRPTT